MWDLAAVCYNRSFARRKLTVFIDMLTVSSDVSIQGCLKQPLSVHLSRVSCDIYCGRGIMMTNQFVLHVTLLQLKLAIFINKFKTYNFITLAAGLRQFNFSFLPASELLDFAVD